MARWSDNRLTNHPAILVSYAYLFESGLRDLLIGVLRAGAHEVMIDSGAFTAHRTGKRISLSAYIETCKRLLEFPSVWGCIMLDKIGDTEQTERNLDAMVRAGVRPMPVLTTDAPLALLEKYVQINKRVCLAGGVGSFTGHEQWIMNRYRSAVQQHPTAQFHGLGYVRFPQMFQSGLRTVDSSSNGAGERFGLVAKYSRSTGISTFNIKDSGRNVPWQTTSQMFRQYLDGCGVTRLQWADDQVMRTGRESFVSMSYALSSVAQALHAQRHGMTVFQAVANKGAWLRCLVVARHLRDNGCFDYWAARRDQMSFKHRPRDLVRLAVEYIRETDQIIAERKGVAA